MAAATWLETPAHARWLEAEGDRLLEFGRASRHPEGGFAWLPSLAWRMDTHWERFRAEVPQVRRRPSEYLREHFWMTTQPIEEPHRPADLHKVFEHLGGTDKVMFSTDYPHWDFDHPAHAFQVRLPAAQRDGIYTENARAFYKLPARITD